MFKDEQGFTLIELVVVVVLLGIIVGTMLAAIILGLRVTDQTLQRLTESNDAQSAASVFVADVQSAVTTGTADTDCVTLVSGTGNVVVSFAWVEQVSTELALDRIVTYASKTEEQVVQDEAGQYQTTVTTLLRVACEKPEDSGDPYTAVTRVVVSLGELSDPFEVACDPACSGKATTVAITATEASGYEFSLSALRRSEGDA